MDPLLAFSSKAEKYARCRWSYAPEAVEAFCRIAGLDHSSRVADIGAGTGILTVPLAARVGWIYAVEPNPEMRREAEKSLAEVPNCTLLSTCAEATGLPGGSLEAIVVAEAAHWFDLERARREFLRILKPGGWLGLLHNAGKDAELGQALTELRRPEYGISPPAFHPEAPWEAYFGAAPIQKYSFPISLTEDWERFFGALISTSYMPDEDHPAFPQLERAARQVFERFSRNGRLAVHGETELMVGQPRRNG